MSVGKNDMTTQVAVRGRRLGGLSMTDSFIDIGIPEAYFQFQEDVRNKVVI